MTRLTLGTAQFGMNYGVANQTGKVPASEVKVMLKMAELHGIDTLDTAIAYGESEQRLGEFGTQSFKLVSKLPSMPNACIDVDAWVQQEFQASLSRLNRKSIYGFLLHSSEQLLGPNGIELYQALQSLKRRGQVQKIGVSIYSPAELDALTPKYAFDLVQAPFNLVDQRIYYTGWMNRLADEGVEIHTRSAFLQGLLLMANTHLPKKFSPWSGLWRTWQRWLADRGCSAVEACLAFPLSFPAIARVVVGADSAKQLEQILTASKVLNPAEYPSIRCDDENLIDPTRWATL